MSLKDLNLKDITFYEEKKEEKERALENKEGNSVPLSCSYLLGSLT